jgi:hypothetical protein
LLLAMLLPLVVAVAISERRYEALGGAASVAEEADED